MATFTPLPFSEARALVAEFDLGELSRVVPIAAGSVNSNFKLEIDGKPELYFLRLYEEQGAAGVLYEAELLAHLAQNGVTTPRPLERRDGSPLSTVVGKSATIFPFVVGVHSCQRAVDTTRAAAVGRALAEIHRAGASFEVRREGRFDLAAMRARLPRIGAASDPMIAAMAPVLDRRLDAWERQRSTMLPRGVIHGDLFRDNVLFRAADGPGHDEVVALLDFESASDGPLIYDLSVAILAWCYGAELDVGLARSMIDGYQQVRILTAEEREGFRAELCLAALRFTVTRITDYALRTGVVGDRVIKEWRRFYARLEAVEAPEVAFW